MENNTSDPEYRNLFRANNQFKNTPRAENNEPAYPASKIPPMNRDK